MVGFEIHVLSFVSMYYIPQSTSRKLEQNVNKSFWNDHSLLVQKQTINSMPFWHFMHRKKYLQLQSFTFINQLGDQLLPFLNGAHTT